MGGQDIPPTHHDRLRRVKCSILLVEHLSYSVGLLRVVEPNPAASTEYNAWGATSEQRAGRKWGDLGTLWVLPRRMARHSQLSASEYYIMARTEFKTHAAIR